MKIFETSAKILTLICSLTPARFFFNLRNDCSALSGQKLLAENFSLNPKLFIQPEQKINVCFFSVLCRLLCALHDEISFFAHPHLHFSFLFNRLFNIQLLDDGRGFDTSHFTPAMIETKRQSYQQKLEALGYANDALYPVLITPREIDQILDEHAAAAPHLDNTLVLVELACWLDATGRLKATKPIDEQLR